MHPRVHEKQNGGWKLSDTDWFYFSLYNPSCFFFMIRVDPSRILFYFYFFIPSKLVWVDPSWSDLDWWSELIRSDFCTCYNFHMIWKLNSIIVLLFIQNNFLFKNIAKTCIIIRHSKYFPDSDWLKAHA